MVTLPDLVRDSKLEVEVSHDDTVQVAYVSNPTTGQRRTRVEERWRTAREVGRGTFGVVRLETCASGPGVGRVRAVKELWKGTVGSTPAAAVSYLRELEAIAKFSQARVRPKQDIARRRTTTAKYPPAVSRLLCSLLRLVRDR